jgi:hypothetical protein
MNLAHGEKEAAGRSKNILTALIFKFINDYKQKT